MRIEDVAKMLNRSVGTIRSYCRGEDLPYRREGNRLVFDRAEVQEWASRPEIRAFLSFGDMTKGQRVPQTAGSAA